MKYYIAGKINGLPNYKELFAAAEKQLIAEGHQVMNPAVLGEGFPYEAYVPICCAMIEQCEALYMLSNWQDSKGAMFEQAYALVTNKQIRYQDTSTKLKSLKHSKIEDGEPHA